MHACDLLSLDQTSSVVDTDINRIREEIKRCIFQSYNFFNIPNHKFYIFYRAKRVMLDLKNLKSGILDDSLIDILREV